MSKRKKLSDADEAMLLSQVDRVCPLCQEPLFYQKKGRNHKKYELAHIYPLNPKPEEMITLQNVELLSKDLNSPDNLIPLCPNCHTKFDKPRTHSEYITLLNLKKKLLSKDDQSFLWKKYSLEEELEKIIQALYDDATELEGNLALDPKTIESKLNASIPAPTQKKIKYNVCEYFNFIKTNLSLLENQSPGTSEQIALQIKVFYLNQKKQNFSQLQIFENLVNWVKVKTKCESIEGAEIIISFFIQNCEVFE
ncbi:ABC-three component system protein [Maridesulfovibrio zosterae]|uniref:ABC-three component system protein n=1 Tax=Maridesulfovibrio zosterae TaxID=82171 RepID=UPI00040E67BB|nr:ABC-three component system protein [Maridesulfovibrio zosterae]